MRIFGKGLALSHHVLRITEKNVSDTVLLKLEGTVKGPWVEELQKAWRMSARRANGAPVSVELEKVSFVDARGLDLLLRMRKEGVVLKGASSFLRHMLGDGDEKLEQSY
jgi:anti-anti-sigma regulatory factor